MLKDKSSKIEKVVVNIGVGRMSQTPNFDDKVLPEVIREASMILGQRPQTRGAKKSIAGFKTRTGQLIGLRATLRGVRARDFLTRVVNVVLPRVKDFRGIDLHSVDKEGHLNFGMREHVVFPEINPEQSKVNFGLGISVVLKDIKDRDDAIAFLRSFGIPLKAK